MLKVIKCVFVQMAQVGSEPRDRQTDTHTLTHTSAVVIRITRGRVLRLAN